MKLEKEIERLIDISIEEDIRTGDLTSQQLIPAEATISANIVLKQAGVLAGLPFLQVLFKKLDPAIQTTLLVDEGSYHPAGTIIGKISGPARGILAGERIALNMIQHASGVATVTSAFVKKIKGLNCAILDTRKTLPGLRILEKYAVRVGGGVNHRFSLDDRFIIKSNHIYFFSGKSPAPIKEAVRKVRASNPNIPIEVEISDFSLLKEALETETEAVMLSRMQPREVKKCVEHIRKTNKKVYVESLGTITLETVRAYAETGVDGISIGSLTHSVPALDIVMRLK
ncbi:MAG TPA: carboxylating nicotinate-nucleotide diphosphorylase [Waddliaceae bacterium]